MSELQATIDPEELSVTSEAPLANKLDNEKPQLGLIPYSALMEEAYVLGYGIEKYGTHNWRQGLQWQRLINSALRHIHAFNNGEDLDSESGLHHLAHARCSLGFLIEYSITHPELDDRHASQAGK